MNNKQSAKRNGHETRGIVPTGSPRCNQDTTDNALPDRANARDWPEIVSPEVDRGVRNFMCDPNVPNHEKYVVAAIYDDVAGYVHCVRAAGHPDAFEAAIKNEQAAGRFVEGAVFHVIGRCNDTGCNCRGDLRKITYRAIM
jgi:hypothetical protein